MTKETPFIYSYKNSFSAGELTPVMDGRTDLGIYQHGVKKLINFFCLPSGGIMRRPGTEYVALLDEEKKDQGIEDQNIFEDFKQNCAIPQKVMIPFVINRDISYLIIFEISNKETKCIAFANAMGEPIQFGKLNFSFNAKDLCFCVDQGICYISFGIGLSVHKIYINPEWTEQHGNKSVEEIAELSVEEKRKVLVIEEHKVDGKCYDQNVTFNEIMSGVEIDKINETINLKAKEEFKSLSCKSLIVFNRRLWCLGLRNNIHGILASFAGSTDNFNVAYNSLLDARNPLSSLYASFLSGALDSVLWSIVFAKELVIATHDGIYILSEGDRVKGEYIRVHKEIDISISRIRPVMINKTVFFVGGDNRQVHSLYYSREKGGYQTSIVNIYAEHMFELGIRCMVGVESPFNMLVAVLNNGSFAAFVYNQDLKLMGWSQHWLGGGTILDAVVIPRKSGDKIYFRVLRHTVDGSKKEFLEFLDCKHLTANYSTIPHETMYIDCCCHLLRSKDTEIDKAFLEVFDDKRPRNSVNAEQLIINKFCGSHINLEDDYIRKNFCIGGVLFDKLTEEQSPLTATKEQVESLVLITKEYFSNYRTLISSLLGLMYGFAMLVEKSLTENKLDTELDNICENAIKIISQINNWEIDASIKKSNLYTKELHHLIDKKLFFSFLTLEEIKGIEDKHFTYLLSQLKLIFNVNEKKLSNVQNSINKLLNIDSKQFLCQLNKEFLYFHAGANTDNTWIQNINTHLFLTGDIGLQGKTLFKRLKEDRLIEQVFENGFKDREKAALWIGTIFSETINSILHGYIANIQDCFFTFNENITNYITEVFMSTFKHYELFDSEFIPKLIVDLMNEYKVKLNDLFGSIEDIIVKPQKTEKKIQEIEDEEHEDKEEIDLEGDMLNWVLNWYIDRSLDTRSLEGFKVALEYDIKLHKLEGLIIYDQILFLKRRDLSILLNLFRDMLSAVYRSTVPRLEREEYSASSLHMNLFAGHFNIWRRLFPDIDIKTIKTLLKLTNPENHDIKHNKMLPIFGKCEVVIVGDEEVMFEGVYDKALLYNEHVHFASLGFKYKSILETFPFIFADEYEHMPKLNATVGVKVYNTKGGYVVFTDSEGINFRCEIISPKFDIMSLSHYKTDRKYLIKEAVNAIDTPYTSGWVDFTPNNRIDKDISMTFIVDKPYPATLLKAYSKAKVLPHVQ